jgi:RNA polymerase sigma-70 factor (ECF subfamily)
MVMANKILEPSSSLIERIKKRDLKAFEEIVTRFQARVYNLAFRILKNEMDAQEATQDVFLAVFTNVHSFEGKSSFYTWLYRIAVNQSLMKKRKTEKGEEFYSSMEGSLPKFTAEGYHLLTIHDWSQQAEDAFLRKELLTKLDTFVDELPDVYRLVFHMIDIDGLSVEEVAEVLDISVAAAKSRLHRSRLFLREKLSSYLRGQ